MRVGREDRRPGRTVPEAKDWDPHTLRRLTEQGYLRQMSDEEAAAALENALADEKVSKIKAAQKRIRKAKAEIEKVTPQKNAAEKALQVLLDRLDSLGQTCAEAAAELKRLGAENMPELSDRQARAKARLAILNRGPELVPDPEPEPEPDKAKGLLVRLNGFTKVQLVDMAENEGIAVSARSSKGEIIEAIAEALKNKSAG
jgi:hypothetical protein